MDVARILLEHGAEVNNPFYPRCGKYCKAWHLWKSVFYLIHYISYRLVIYRLLFKLMSEDCPYNNCMCKMVNAKRWGEPVNFFCSPGDKRK